MNILYHQGKTISLVVFFTNALQLLLFANDVHFAPHFSTVLQPLVSLRILLGVAYIQLFKPVGFFPRIPFYQYIFQK